MNNSSSYLKYSRFCLGMFLILISVIPLTFAQGREGQAASNNRKPMALDPSLVKRPYVDQRTDSTEQIVSNAFVVQFKSDGPYALDSDIESPMRQGKDLKNSFADKSDSIDKLNAKHRVLKDKTKLIFTKESGLSTAHAKRKQADFVKKIKAKFAKRAQRALPHIPTPNILNTYRFEVPEGSDLERIIADYRADPHVIYVETIPIYKTSFVPNDPYYSTLGSWEQSYDDLWGLKRIHAAEAWDTTQAEGIIVAVIDSGIDYNHEDIVEQIWINVDEIPGNNIDDDQNGYIDDVKGFDFVSYDNDPKDDNGHGTHVAGTIAAIGNNNIGIIGVAPRAKVMALKGLNSLGRGEADYVAEALYYAVNNGADIINNSWGGPGSRLITDAINYAYSQGCVILAAAGNSDTDVSRESPANLANVITIASSDQNDNRSSFSNYGIKIDVTAPGGADGADGYNILSLLAANSYYSQNSFLRQFIIGSNYIRINGTSMACPHAAGLAALILSHHPSFTNEDVRHVLRVSADDVGNPGFDQETGFGRINAQRAIAIDSVLRVDITNPITSSVIDNAINIIGTATGQNFSYYELSYARKNDLLTWIPIGSRIYTPINNGVLGTLNPAGLEVDNYLLRLVATTTSGLQFSKIIEFTVEFFIRPIAIDNHLHYAPVISDNYIVWYGYDGSASNSDIFVYDLTTNTSRQITSDMFDQNSPVISDNFIVWVDYRNGNQDIYLYDLLTNTERQITNDPADQMNPAISGTRIVWEDHRNGNTDIYMYDFAINREQRITFPDLAGGSVNYSHPSISGNYIVWFDNSKYTIYGHDLFTNTTQPIIQIENERLINHLVISGDYIVWQEFRNGLSNNPGIYLYNLTTNIEKQVTTNMSNPRELAISGSKIVWADYRNGASDIYMYELNTDTERRITAQSGIQLHPSISGNQVVWQDLRNGNADIYLYNPNISSDLVTLGIDKNGSGRLQGIVTSVPEGINCGEQCEFQLPMGTRVTLNATSTDPNVNLALWSPCGTTPTCTVTLNGDMMVEADFRNTATSNLQIQSISTDPQQVFANQSMQIKTMVKNWGDGPVSGGMLALTVSTTGWNHSVNLPISNLSPGAQQELSAPLSLPSAGTYQVRGIVSSINDSNLNNNQRDVTFNTSVDTTRPTVQLTAPANGTMINSGASVTVSASASDTDSGIQRVEFYRDTILLATATTAPYQISWNTAGVALGSHSLLAKAFDRVGNQTTSTIVNVTIADATPPTIALTAPTNGTVVVPGTGINLSASASDVSGVGRVEFYLDGTTLLGTDTTAPYNLIWTPSVSLPVGTHSLTAKAYDNAGNIGTSSAVAITVRDVTAPSVVMTAPANGSTVARRSTVTITANASDNVGVSRVEFYVNGTLKGTDTTSPYTCPWTVPNQNGANYSLQAKGYDAAGNLGTSPMVSVTAR